MFDRQNKKRCKVWCALFLHSYFSKLNKDHQKRKKEWLEESWEEFGHQNSHNHAKISKSLEEKYGSFSSLSLVDDEHELLL